MINDRPTFNDTFFDVCKVFARRSTCIRREVGAVAVKNNRLIATGYNGAPPGVSHCTHDTCIRTVEHIPSGEKAEKCRGIHAEQNIIIQAAMYGVSLYGCDIYCTTAPCNICMKMLLPHNPRKIMFLEYYNDDLAIKVAKECGYRFYDNSDQRHGYYMWAKQDAKGTW